jgi:hypothetical protein
MQNENKIFSIFTCFASSAAMTPQHSRTYEVKRMLSGVQLIANVSHGGLANTAFCLIGSAVLRCMEYQ